METGYKERKVIVVNCCDTCPFIGKCKAWKKLTRIQRVSLTLKVGMGGFILKGCPLPDGEDNAKPFGRIEDQ